MALTSRWFSGNTRCEQCEHIDASHIQRGDSGLHVFLVQYALLVLDSAAIALAERDSWTYGASTAAAVLHYKQKRDIVNRSYQKQADDIVGKMTIASLDTGMRTFESGFALFGGAGLMFGRLLLAAPKLVPNARPQMVVITEGAQPWSKWAEQFVAANPGQRSKVPIPDGATPAAISGAYARAIALAGTGGTVIISVGHGIPADTSTDDGMFDLGPHGSFRIGGRNATLIGDPPPRNPPPGKPVSHHTQVFYADSPPKPRRSRKADDEDSGSANAKVRLANWKAYDDIATAFKSQRLAMVVMLTCRIGGSTGMIKRVSQQWNNPILGYTRKIAGQEVDGRVRVFLEGDPPGNFHQWPSTSNTPAGETFFPLSRHSVQVNP